MSETVETAAKVTNVGLAVKSAVTTAKPGITIVKFWQGIVDVVLRAVVLAVALLVFIIGAVFSGNAVVFVNGYSSAGGWLAFVSFVIMVIETILIVGRFINFAFVYQYSLVVMIVDAAIHGVTALCVLPAFIATAVYAARLFPPARDSAIALVLFAVVFMGILVAVVVYALLWYFMKWFEILKNKYEGGTSTEPTDYDQD